MIKLLQVSASLLLLLTAFMGACATLEDVTRSDPGIPLTEFVVNQYLNGAQVIAIGETHGLETLHREIRLMLADPQFSATRVILVVEFANSLHQAVINRYISGETVPETELVRIWRDTSVSPLQNWQGPMYRGFFYAVRELNRQLPPDEKLRVIAAGRPIDWASIHSQDDHFPYLARSSHFAEVIQREVLENKERALFIAGAIHTMRVNPDPTPSKRVRDTGAGTILSKLLGESYISIGVHTGVGSSNTSIEESLEAIESATVFAMRGSLWQICDASEMFSDTIRVRSDGTTYNPFAGEKLEKLFDAMLYIGQAVDLEYPPDDPIIDIAELEEMNRRAAIFGLHIPKSSADTP